MRLREFQKLLAARMLDLREAQALSQEEASRRAGITRQHLQRLESGRMNPTIATVFHMACAYNVSVGQLIGLAESGRAPRRRRRPSTTQGRTR